MIGVTGRKWLRGLMLVVAIAVTSAGIAFALVEFTREVDATVTVQLQAPDGIEIYLDDGLTQIADFVDFGDPHVDLFGTASGVDPVPVWIKNHSLSAVELTLDDDYADADVVLEGEDHNPVLQPDEVLPAVLTLDFDPSPIAGPQPFTMFFHADGPVAEAVFGGTLRYVPQGSIKFVDTMATGAIVTGTVGRHSYDQLFWRDSDYNIFPQMAESWSLSPDGKTYTFNVRAGITFHNGDPLRMLDIAESHNRFARRDPLGRQLLAISAGNEGQDLSDQVFNVVIDEVANTLVMQFEQPTAMVLEFLAQVDPRQPSIMHEDGWSIAPGAPFGQPDAIGTGAYEFVEWIPDESLTFEKFTNYVPNAGEPWNFTKGEIVQYLDGFVAFDIPEHATRIAALLTGEVDVLDDFRIEMAPSLDGNPDVMWSPIRDGNYGTMSFNHNHAPFDMSEAGVLAKRAVQASSPNAEIMLAAVGAENLWSECYTVIHCGTPWESVVGQEVQDEGLKTRDGDLTYAASLLDQAEALRPGTRDMQIRVIGASDMPYMPEAALVHVEAMGDTGFTDVELVLMLWADRVALTGSDGPWEAATSWSNFANGLNPLAPHMPASGGSGGWVDEVQTELRDAFLVETDPVKLQQLFDDMNRQIYSNPPSINTFQFSPPRAMRADVKGYCLDCLFPVLHNVWLDR